MKTFAKNTNDKTKRSQSSVEERQARALQQSTSLTNEHPQAQVQATVQQMADDSPQVRQIAQMQAMADGKRPNRTGLPDSLKAGIENLSGQAMDDVKVHYNSDKPAALQAHAYAQGAEIHLASGQEKHLPHEAWHVVQQKQGRVRPTMQLKGAVNVNDDVGLEKEADVMGTIALQFKPSDSYSEPHKNSLRSSNPLTQRFVIQFSLAPKDAEKLKGIFVKWVTKHKKSVFTPYFLSELEGAIIAFYTYQDAYDYLVDVVEKHAEFVGKFQGADLGERIGRGSEKEVYTLANHPGIVIGISSSDDLEGALARMKDEATLLDDLKVKAKIPVAEIIGIIEYKGRAATLMYRYAEGSKSVVTNDKENFNAPVRIGNSAHLNATSINDLNEIMVKFQRNKIRIDDIQFLIGSDGSVVVSDPLSLEMGNNPPTTNMIQMILRLMETAAENELYDFLQENRRPFRADELTAKIISLNIDRFLVSNVLKGIITNYSTMIKWDSSTNTYRYSSFDEVD